MPHQSGEDGPHKKGSGEHHPDCFVCVLVLWGRFPRAISAPYRRGGQLGSVPAPNPPLPPAAPKVLGTAVGQFQIPDLGWVFGVRHG